MGLNISVPIFGFFIVTYMCFVPTGVRPAEAGPLPGWDAKPIDIQISPYYAVIVPAAQLGTMLGMPTDRIGLFTQRDGKLAPIPFQIDRKNADGRYLIPDPQDKSEPAVLGAQDECVFMPEDAGAPLAELPAVNGASAVQAIRVRTDGDWAWVYAIAFNIAPTSRSHVRYMDYDAAKDILSSDVYRAGFSPNLPFLMRAFQWKNADTGQWGPNLVDTMKLKHTGKMFGVAKFLRTHEDYRSRLVAVKTGPVRIIRRTRSNVSMMLGLRTPSIYMDYIAYRHFAVMDTIIDLPFPIGWFFSDVETLSTVDLRDVPELPATRILHRSVPDGIAIDGVTMPGEHDLGKEKDTDFVITNRFGQILVQLDVDKELAIHKRIHFIDNKAAPDPPEDVPGQFGHSGYATTGWESVGRGVHHMQFSFTLVPQQGARSDRSLLERIARTSP